MLNLNCEINYYRLTLGCNAAKKTKQDKTKLIKPNNPQISIHKIYVYTINTRISNVTFTPQLVLFDRPLTVIYYNDVVYIYIYIYIYTVMGQCGSQGGDLHYCVYRCVYVYMSLDAVYDVNNVYTYIYILDTYMYKVIEII